MTKIAAVRFAIDRLEKEQERVSEKGKRLTPMEGAEEEYWKLEEAIIQLKATCQAMQSELVRKSMAEWDVMESIEPEMRLR